MGRMDKCLGNLDEGYTGILYITFAIFFSLYQSKKNQRIIKQICEFTIQLEIQTVSLRNPVPLSGENPSPCATVSLNFSIC